MLIFERYTRALVDAIAKAPFLGSGSYFSILPLPLGKISIIAACLATDK